uniref:Si:ch1073-75f15.2 n=1 Tax=Cynoglossus semilaevis TaxID=244447 RepID=A0A3P8VJ68_CYNSE
QGESRMMRMQFDGRKRAEAVKECSSAAEKLKEYVTVTTQNGPTPPNNQPPAEVSAPVPQHFLGEAALNLPQVYHHSPLAENELKPILRVCLLDPNFHALVEKVESELKKLLQE